MMRAFFLILALASSAFAQAPAADFWLRMYQPPAFFEIWRLTLSVKDFDKALKKALEILDKKGESMVPLANMAGSEKAGFQQLSYRVPADSAPKVFSALQKLGETEDLQKNPGIDPKLRDEVGEKLTRLRFERDSHEIALRDSPAIRGAVDEIVSHLEAFQKTDAEAKGRILLNVQIQQKAKKN